MNKRGHQPGVKLTEDHRVKIKNSNILNALIEHAEGRRDMTSTQVTAGIALLKKCLPDLQSISHTGENGGPVEIVTKAQRDAAVNAALRADT